MSEAESRRGGSMIVELVYHAGCPQVATARVRLRQAMVVAGMPAHWIEWDVTASGTPERVKTFASPTVLVDGVDVMAGGPTGGLACAVGGAPPVAVLEAALARGVRRDDRLEE